MNVASKFIRTNDGSFNVVAEFTRLGILVFSLHYSYSMSLRAYAEGVGVVISDTTKSDCFAPPIDNGRGLAMAKKKQCVEFIFYQKIPQTRSGTAFERI